MQVQRGHAQLPVTQRAGQHIDGRLISERVAGMGVSPPVWADARVRQPGPFLRLLEPAVNRAVL